MNTRQANIDKRQVARQFSRAAARYDSLASLQQAMAAKLVGELAGSESGCLVDLGCGTGSALAAIEQLDQFSRLIGVDLAPGMIEFARRKYGGRSVEWICGDLEALPLEDTCADVVFSSAAIQWCRPAAAFVEMRRVIKPRGRLLLSSFGPRTLEQLHAAWEALDANFQPIHQQCEAESLIEQMGAAGFKVETETTQVRLIEFSDVDALLENVRGVGAGYAGSDRTEKRLTRQQYQRLRELIAQHAAQSDQLGLTYDCIFVTARAMD